MQNIMQALQFFVSDHTADFGLWQTFNFLFALFSCALLAWVLAKVYVKYGNSLSNRKAFAKNFLVLATTTMFIIAVVKSSLALSLGLVGALSIVRFRSAIKEPEELTYLFLNIAIGLGCGAGQILITLLSFIFIVVFIVIGKGRIFRAKNDQSAGGSGMSSYLLIVCENKAISLPQIISILTESSNTVKLKRTDEAAGRFEASFFIDFDEWRHFERMREQLFKLDENMKVTFMDTSKDY
jgi:uncharacterized membrane protein YhiD involved in acid resistance